MNLPKGKETFLCAPGMIEGMKEKKGKIKQKIKSETEGKAIAYLNNNYKFGFSFVL